ncbi:MAG: SBBP repeat-containing protein [Bacteroidetes bacterium]|nr:SBBP repeat-containing protein [Bacteroidota bacterium]
MGKVLANKPFQTSDTLNYISDMVVDGSGSIILFGTFETFLDADPGPGTYNLSSQDAEVYLLKLNSAGIFEWVKQIGNPNNYLESNSIKLDGFGNIYLSGFFIEELILIPDGIFSRISKRLGTIVYFEIKSQRRIYLGTAN